MLNEFKKFAIKGNMVDLAIGFILGGAFSTIVKSLVNDIIMPPIGLLMGGVDFTNLFITLKGVSFSTIEAAKEAGSVTLNYGVFINNVISFLIVAIVLFFVVKGINKAKEAIEDAVKKDEEVAAAAPVIPPAQELLLAEIRDLLKKQSAS
ncbi:MAG: large conductance mechanosensitive channel protein MscL [Rhizobiales bacterium]|nr:large conductance mechanosensitive channel protein MscL [Hyphomicrobiales bacterium]NRB15683.1 large conductance mechanosensitive channel protein MscL [Hyphomicrobiales bacterium]